MTKHTDTEIKRAAARFEQWADTLSREDFEYITDLRAIAEATDAVRSGEVRVNELVQLARANGRSWTQIGIALGVSRQPRASGSQRSSAPEHVLSSIVPHREDTCSQAGSLSHSCECESLPRRQDLRQVDSHPWQHFGNVHIVRCVRCVRKTRRYGQSGRSGTYLHLLYKVEGLVRGFPGWRFESSHPHFVMSQDIGDRCVKTSETLAPGPSAGSCGSGRA
jgi:hypothetical protein